MTTEAEFDDLMARHIAGIAARAREELERAAPVIAAFTRYAAEKGVNLHAENFEYVQTIGIVAKAPGIARALLGPLPTERDGLVPYTELAARLPPSRFQEGLFVGTNYIVLAHPYYRRQMHTHANWAPRFVDLFCGFDSPDVQKYIAIDEDRVRINVDGTGYFEADSWYGAPFDEDIRKIKSGTVKLRPPLDLERQYIDFLFAKAYCLDIKWSESKGVKTFQSLEIKTEDVQLAVDGTTYFPARYMHAEFDIATNRFRHFDGAVQLYREEEYLQRRDSDFNMPMKNRDHIKARSKKIFKFNGPLTTSSWVEFCCHFYTANPLTFEYFTGAYPEHVVDILTKVNARRELRANDA